MTLSIVAALAATLVAGCTSVLMARTRRLMRDRQDVTQALYDVGARHHETMTKALKMVDECRRAMPLQEWAEVIRKVEAMDEPDEVPHDATCTCRECFDAWDWQTIS